MALRGFMQNLIRTQGDGVNELEVNVINDNSTSSILTDAESLRRYSFHNNNHFLNDDNDGDTHTTDATTTTTDDQDNNETSIFLMPDNDNLLDNNGSVRNIDYNGSIRNMTQLPGDNCNDVNDVDIGGALQGYRSRHRLVRESLYNSYNSPACSRNNKFSPLPITTQSTPPSQNDAGGHGHVRRDNQRSRMAQLSSSAANSSLPSLFL